MSGQLITIQCLMNACVARISGMNAENTERERNGYALAYDDNAFGQVADELERLAIEARTNRVRGRA